MAVWKAWMGLYTLWRYFFSSVVRVFWSVWSNFLSQLCGCTWHKRLWCEVSPLRRWRCPSLFRPRSLTNCCRFTVLWSVNLSTWNLPQMLLKPWFHLFMYFAQMAKNQMSTLESTTALVYVLLFWFMCKFYSVILHYLINCWNLTVKFPLKKKKLYLCGNDLVKQR